MSVLHHDDGLVPTTTDPHPWDEPIHPTVWKLTDGADQQVDNLAAIKGIAVSIALSLPFWVAVAVLIHRLRS
jgi:hypothetical protein